MSFKPRYEDPAGHRKCRGCLETKPFSGFYVYRDGRVYSRCRDCVRVEMRDYQSRRRAEMRKRLHEAKAQPCMDCGVQYPPYVMQFDHVRGEKLFNLSHLGNSGCSKKRFLAELAKCELVCANCHAERTHQRARPGTLEPVANADTTELLAA